MPGSLGRSFPSALFDHPGCVAYARAPHAARDRRAPTASASKTAARGARQRGRDRANISSTPRSSARAHRARPCRAAPLPSSASSLRSVAHRGSAVACATSASRGRRGVSGRAPMTQVLFVLCTNRVSLTHSCTVDSFFGKVHSRMQRWSLQRTRGAAREVRWDLRAAGRRRWKRLRRRSDELPSSSRGS